MQNYAKLCKKNSLLQRSITGSNENQEKLSDMHIQYADLCKTMQNYAKRRICCRDPLQDPL